VSGDSAAYGPYLSAQGDVVHKDLWLEGAGAQPPMEASLSVESSWSTRMYTMLYGTALLSSNFDASFLQKAQVGLVGASDPINIAPNFEEVTLTDPQSGRVYVAYRDPNGNPNQFLAAKLIDKINVMVDDLEALAQDDAGAPRLRAMIQNEIETLEMLRSLYNEFQFVF
jgi:hypothetical protein